MNVSKGIILAGLVAFGLPLAASSARVPVTLIEASVETRASDLGLPADDRGIITARACPACSAQTFYFSKEPALLVNGRKVDLAQLKSALQRAGNAPVSVYYRRADSLVTRIVFMNLNADASR
jgi:hypothetical protein